MVTIREAGTYRISGTLTQGQLAVDLGEDAQEDTSAVVTVILDGVDITCTVAPAFMVYRVYECGSLDTENATSSVDTSAADINVILADGSENSFTGSHVAKIYQEGTTDKLHKYDGAFYSKMTMNIDGEAQGTGILNIDGDNEGLGTELHLTIHGGYINILSQNDGINTNEDNLSVITINGGTIQIDAGLGEEGDGIDSNGYLVINGGNVYTTACEQGTDGGLDATLDIQLNGGFLVALGNQHDAVSPDSQQEYLVLSFTVRKPGRADRSRWYFSIGVYDRKIGTVSHILLSEFESKHRLYTYYRWDNPTIYKQPKRGGRWRRFRAPRPRRSTLGDPKQLRKLVGKHPGYSRGNTHLAGGAAGTANSAPRSIG